MPPLSTRWPPNHMMPTMEKFDDDEQHREHDGEEPEDATVVSVRSWLAVAEALLLVVGAHERPDDPDAAQGLTHDVVDAVEPRLHGPEERDGLPKDQEEEDDHDRQDDGDGERQRHVLAQGHDDAADGHHRA